MKYNRQQQRQQHLGHRGAVSVINTKQGKTRFVLKVMFAHWFHWAVSREGSFALDVGGKDRKNIRMSYRKVPLRGKMLLSPSCFVTSYNSSYSETGLAAQLCGRVLAQHS